MCGISGVILKNNISKEKLEKYIKNLLELQHNRGPDDNGHHIFNNLVLGHNRLSIIDLNNRSKQPFQFKNLVLSFNGEIYNYIELRESLIKKYNEFFKTTSDTEVLIKMFYYYGIEKTLNQIEGMFSIILLNKITNKLFLIRDRIGIKLCYYYNDENIFMFASTPGPIAKTLYKFSNKKFDIDKYTLFYYLSSGLCPTNKSLFENIYGLKPAHIIEYNLYDNIFASNKWWTPNLKNNLNLEEILDESVKQRENSDVDGSVIFSGGIDSSIICYFNSKI